MFVNFQFWLLSFGNKHINIRFFSTGATNGQHGQHGQLILPSLSHTTHDKVWFSGLVVSRGELEKARRELQDSEKLKATYLKNCKILYSANERYADLSFLYLKNCKILYSANERYADLSFLYLKNCKILYSANERYAGLSFLYLKNCKILYSANERYAGLSFLYLKNCKILYSANERYAGLSFLLNVGKRMLLDCLAKQVRNDSCFGAVHAVWAGRKELANP